MSVERVGLVGPRLVLLGGIIIINWPHYDADGFYVCLFVVYVCVCLQVPEI